MYSDKVKQIVKKWQRFACTGGYSKGVTTRMQEWSGRKSGENLQSFQEEYSASAAPIPEGSLAVFVGRERRRYILRDQYVNHPLFKSLLARSNTSITSSSSSSDSEEGISIPCCEIVLFEHLLWLLGNDESGIRDSVDELVEFYACS